MNDKKYIFFRDDDVCRLNQSFLSFFKLFLRRRVPMVYGVIPARLENKLADFLLKQKKKNPDLIDIAQHGWSHRNYGFKTRSKYEFGSSRKYIEQKIDILKGYLQMHKGFDADFSKIFIPPFHGYNFDTLKIINFLAERKNINIFSSGAKTFPKEKKFLDLPTLINFSPQQNFCNEKYLKEILESIHKNFQNHSALGILFHHEKYDFKKRQLIKKFLHSLKKYQPIDFVLPSKLAKNRKISKIDLTLEITNRCNLKCKACDIWQEKLKKNLNFKTFKYVMNEFLKFYSIGSVSLTGGEPFLNPDLDKIVQFLISLKEKKMIDSIGIYTNGFAGRKIVNFFNSNHDFAKFVELGISLDGNRTNHNYLRGNPHSYENVKNLIKDIKRMFPKIVLSIKFTISKKNYKDLLKIYLFCRNQKFGFLPKFVELNTKNYYHRSQKKQNINFLLSKNENDELKLMLWKIKQKENKYMEKIIDDNLINVLIHYTKRGYEILKNCFVPMYTLFISHKGDVFPCLYVNPVTNIYENAWLKKIMGSNHINLIKDGIDLHCEKCFAYHGYLKNLSLY
ncbi:MAG: Radical SAM domain-containing protein [Candidatus Berkelbacteria bacterium Licking1014_85]|uniref:Radical SAM domain-containing protein n=1 Tax=Candidatus Berkelbacteria bacterium Licking1014_85 TaxID=2017148 RepID=A0A554LKZ9_9BACT|nr:MAG: Radical SAM domain-containing protein [Candidatus Berkelbacteria bacterium Licking1014_85]